MHDDHWAGVESALSGAQFHLIEASRSLQPPERTAISVVLKSAGTIVWKPWEEPFYSNVRSFLQQARSVPFVIESCFGRDNGIKELKAWFNALSEDEQADDSSSINSSSLIATSSGNTISQRQQTSRCIGFAPVEGVVIGRPTGKPYPASPIMSVPIAEALPPATMRRCGPELNRRFQFGLPGMSSKSTESPCSPN